MMNDSHADWRWRVVAMSPGSTVLSEISEYDAREPPRIAEYDARVWKPCDSREWKPFAGTKPRPRRWPHEVEYCGPTPFLIPVPLEQH